MTDDTEQTVTTGEIVSEPIVTGDWLSPPLAADRLGVSESTLWRLLRQGRYQKRVVNRRAEILVPMTGSSVTEESRENTSLVPVKSDSMTLAVIQELQASRQQDAQEIASLRAELLRLTGENAAMRERLLPWRERLRRWWSGDTRDSQ